MSSRRDRRRHSYQAATSRATFKAEPGSEQSRPPKKMTKPPKCASRFGHAFSVTAIYGSVTTYPDGGSPTSAAGKKRCTSTSYEADEHCTRRGCHVTRHTDGRPDSRDNDGNPTHTYGTLPLHAQAVKNSTGAKPDRMVQRRRRTNGHIDAKKKPGGGRNNFRRPED